MGAKLSNQDSTILWTSEEIANAVKGQCGADFNITGVQIDSRAIEPGDLFIAIKAERDGHDFAKSALNHGAGGVLISDNEVIGSSQNYVLCDDTMLALESLGAAARRRALITKRIAITGSVGKTTVKELTSAALSASGKTHKSVKSYNNHWGVPLTLSRMPINTRYGVFEIGMNHTGEIALLSPQVKPHIAAITTVAPVHIEHFGTIEAIADAKAEIFLGIENGGYALIPNENPMSKRLKQRASDIDNLNIVTFGMKQNADAKITRLIDNGDYRIIHADIMGKNIEWRVSEPGDHWIHNGLCAITLVHLAGGDLEAAASVLSNFGALEGRGAVKTITTKDGVEFSLVDEAYNANPTSVAAALRTLANRHGRRKIAVLGDMLELGDKENEYHAELIDAVLKSNVDLVFLAGSRMKYLWDLLPANKRGNFAYNSKELLPRVLESVQSGDCIMVKGSNGSHMNVIVAGLANLKNDSLKN